MISDSRPATAQAPRERLPLDRLRVVFMGTPQFAAAILSSLLAEESVNVAAVFTQPDRPAGRGNKLKAPETKTLAEASGIPVHQPLNFRETPDGNAATALLASYAPQVLVVAAYGLILPQRVLDIPSLMPVNVHASLLPKYRGAAPIQRSIMNGDTATGITIMRMEAGLDTGPILLQRALGIGMEDTALTLERELAAAGAELLLEALRRLQRGELASIPQDAQLATYAQKLSKEESYINLSMPAASVHARIRGLTPWPGAVLTLHRPSKDPMRVHVRPGRLLPCPTMQDAELPAPSSISCGSIYGVKEDSLLVACGDGWYALTELQPSGKRGMSAAAFFNGYLAGYSGSAFHCAASL